MVLFRTIQCIGASILLTYCSFGFAGKKNNIEPAAVITFNSTSASKEMVYSAYKTTTRMTKTIRKLFYLACRVIAESSSTSTNVDYYNAKFQMQKQGLVHALHKAKIQMSPLFVSEITIDVIDDGYGNHRYFNLPQLDFSELLRTSIETVENANKTILYLTALIEKIEDCLPTDASNDGLSKFADPQTLQQLNTDSKNQLKISHIEESKTIIETLYSIKDEMMRSLNQLLDLAKVAASGAHTENEMKILVDSYFETCHTFVYSFDTKNYNPLREIKLFNDITLTFEMNGKTHEYFFPQINLSTLNLKEDTILNIDAASLTIKHLSVAFNWVLDWIITGNTLLSEIDQNKLLNVFSQLHIDPQVAALVEKHFGT